MGATSSKETTTKKQQRILGMAVCGYGSQESSVEVQKKDSLKKTSDVMQATPEERSSTVEPHFMPWLNPQFVGPNIIDRNFVKFRKLGSGGSADVYRVKEKATGKFYALKQIPRKREYLFTNECLALLECPHPGVIKMENYYADDSNYYIVTELADADLLHFLRLKGRQKERKVASMVEQVLQVVAQLHAVDMVHRDIKLENIVFCNWNKKGERLKLIDFANAGIIEDHTRYTESAGTVSYWSPERFRDHYGWELRASDLWAVGVVTLELLTGRRAFMGSYRETKEKVLKQQWSYPSWLHPSARCHDFIKTLLSPDPSERISARDMLRHPFIAGGI